MSFFSRHLKISSFARFQRFATILQRGLQRLQVLQTFKGSQFLQTLRKLEVNSSNQSVLHHSDFRIFRNDTHWCNQFKFDIPVIE